MLRKLIAALCGITGEDVDAVVETLGIKVEDLAKRPSAHMKVVLADTFNVPIVQVGAIADAMELRQDDPANQYSVCFLFNENLTHVLLQRKLRTDFAGLLNGVGGTQRPDEDKFQGALREIQEETGVCQKDIVNFKYLGTLTLPYDCKPKTDTTCILHYFTGVVWGDKPSPQPGEPELLEWHNVNYVQNTPVSMAEKQFAGNGDLQYFVHMALRYHNDARSMDAAHALKKSEPQQEA